MSDQFWRRLDMIFGLMAIGVVFGLAAFTSGIEIKDLDLWLHLKMGQVISAQHAVPSSDVLSCTIVGKPWVNHEWLFQVLVYQINQCFGFDGLIMMQTVVVVATLFILLLLGYQRDRQWLVAFLLLLLLLVYQTRFTIRPDIFSLLFLVMFVHILSAHLSRRSSLYALVAMQVIWTNMHGFFFFGPLLALIGVGVEAAKRHLPLPWQWKETGRLNDVEYRHLKIAVVVLLAATCINPLWFEGALYPWRVMAGLGTDSKIFFKHIYELQQPIAWANVWTVNNLYYKLLIFISALGFIFNYRRIDLSALVLWGIFLAFSLGAIRNLIFFGVIAYLVCLVNASHIVWSRIVPLRFTQEKFKSITSILIKGALIMWMMNFGMHIAANGYFDFDTYERKSEFGGVSKRNYPTKAVDFLVRNQIKGNFFNDFNSGAYLVGRAYPDIKVFIDGRTEVYGAEFFQRYQKIWKDGNRSEFISLARANNITGAFLNNTNQEIPKPALRMFYRLKGWSMVYFDDDAVIFLKQTPSNQPLIDRFAVDLKKWTPKPMDLQRLGSKRITPLPFINRAYALEVLGFDEAALKELDWAIKIAPDEASIYKIAGKIYGRRKQHHKAFENFRIAATLSPGDVQIRVNLAVAYEHLKDFKGAAYQYERIIELDPDNPKGHFGLAKAYALDGQKQKALDALAQAQKMSPEDKVDVKKIHAIIDKNKGS